MKKTIAIGIAVFLVCLVLIPSVSADWLSGWDYRKTINITGQTGAGTHHQVNLSIGDSSGGDFHLEGHCTDFPNDTVVTDGGGITKLPFWIENASADPIQMWVNVSDDLNTSQDVCIYYGKSGESSASNITNTFLFGDDFGDGDYTSNPTWTVGSGTWSAANYYLQKTATSGVWEYISVPSTTAYGIWEYNTKMVTTTSQFQITIINAIQAPETESDYFLAYDGNANTLRLYRYDGAFHDLANGAFDADTNWHKYKITRNNTGLFTVYIDGNQILSVTDNAITTSNYITFRPQELTSIDNLRIRKYNSPEPAYSSAGSEENAHTIPPDPTNLQNTTGNFWVNYTWDVGSGNVTNSYNITNQTEWFNGTINTYYNESVSANEWVNITVYAWNSSGSGTLSAGSVSDQVQVLVSDTTFTVSLPVGYTKPVFQPPNSTATNYPPNGQTSSQEFYNVSNSGNVNLDIRMRLNTTVSTITLKADDDNTPAGAQTIGTNLVTLYTGLPQGDTADIWLWSDFDHTPPQTANRTVYINVSES